MFDAIGLNERPLNSNIDVVEGQTVSFSVRASDPEGDPLVISASGVPPWASFDPATGLFIGAAPLYSANAVTRRTQTGMFAVTFSVTDGSYTVTKIVVINVLDATWGARTVAQLVAGRPISDGTVGAAITLRNVVEQTITYSGTPLRQFTFAATLQVPVLTGTLATDDWDCTRAAAYVPVSAPIDPNVGAVMIFGESVPGLNQRVAAELGIPVLVLQQFARNIDSASVFVAKYMNAASDTRNPGYLFHVFAAGMYLRGGDALLTLLRDHAGWAVDQALFRIGEAGFSKYGSTSRTRPRTPRRAPMAARRWMRARPATGTSPATASRLPTRRKVARAGAAGAAPRRPAAGSCRPGCCWRSWQPGVAAGSGLWSATTRTADHR
ncbi:MAG: hypothetical protein HY906_26300 [Deltaproteobacteria bacterium]|nr:hypothetical protein [Deltaproteobacteria bacterium]